VPLGWGAAAAPWVAAAADGIHWNRREKEGDREKREREREVALTGHQNSPMVKNERFS
jgi:hypothetical protein